MSGDTKICPICAETIKAAAKKCPHCLQWQTKWHSTVLHPAFGVSLAAMIVAGIVWILILLGTTIQRSSSPGEDFSRHRDQIQIVESSMHYSYTTNGPMISTVGKLRNNTPFAWDWIQLEVQYFDESGKLIDTKSESNSVQSMLPKDEHAFRIRTVADKLESAYASHKVFVRSARETGRW